MSQCLNADCLAVNPETHRFCQKCGQKLWLKDRYQALKLIGQGGFGKTFLAIDHDIPRKPRCVIKQFFPQGQGTAGLQKAAELFAEEAKRLDELGNHPQIPALLAYFIHEDKRQYLVQEYIEGENLEQELKSLGVFNEAKIRALLADLLPVLAFIHQRGVIHRDIKPENIIRRKQDNKLVLVDFGAAKAVTPVNRSMTGTIIGSFDYMAPEQGSGKAVNASDLYSLGVTCLYLLTGKSPSDLFNSEEHEWAWRKYLIDNLVNDNLAKVLDKMIIFGTKKRYQNAIEIWNELKPKSSKQTKIQSSSASQHSTSTELSNKKNIGVKDYSKIYGQAYVAYGKGYYEEAAKYIQEMEDAYPNDPNVLLLEGHIQVGLSHYDIAKKKYEAVLRLTHRQDLLDCAEQALDQISVLIPNLGSSYSNVWTVNLLLDAYASGQRNFQEQDFQELMLNGYLLPSISFYSSNLSNTSFQDANLNRADFGKAILLNTVFTNANLSDAYFGYANLEGANFRKANLCGTNFIYANLRGANFCGVDLSSTQITSEQLATVKKNWLTIMPKKK